MAGHYGQRSKRSIYKEGWQQFRTVLAWLAVVLILVIVFIYGFSSITSSVSAFLVALVFAATILTLLVVYSRATGKAARIFSRRIEGEGIVSRELMKLSDAYLVFSDILLPESKSHIDFVILCTRGVFTVEVRNDRGNLSMEDGELMIDNKGFQGERLLQHMKKQSGELGRYIAKTTEYEVPINSVLAFSDAEAKMDLEMRPVEEVHIVPVRRLNEIVAKYPSILTPTHVKDIEEQLKALTKSYSYSAEQ